MQTRQTKQLMARKVTGTFKKQTGPLLRFLLRGGGSVHRVHLGACSQTNRKGAPFL